MNDRERSQQNAPQTGLRRSLILVVVAAFTMLMLVAFGLPAAAQTDATLENGVSLTIYNRGTALVQDRRTFALNAGQNVVDFTDVASQIDATSVVLSSLTDSEGMQVLEQDFIYDLVDVSALLQRYLDQEIEVFTADGVTFEGQLLSGRNGQIILREADGNVVVVASDDVRNVSFPELPSGLITRPTLRWQLWSGASGDQQVELTYLTGGMNWTADYNILLGSDYNTLDLSGWVTLTNTSGTAYSDAQVKLIAGDVNRLPEPRREVGGDELILPTPTPLPTQTPVGQVEQRNFYEYHLYEITRPVTVGNNETKQVEFVTGTDVPAHTFYVYNASYPFYGYSYPIYDQNYYGTMGATNVQHYLEFSTSEEDGLGADLPAGRVRVYQEDVDGAALFIRQNSIDHTPEGEDVQLFLGNAYDLTGEHVQADFVASNYAAEETFEITLRNYKPDATVEIRVPETLYRWSNWEIIEASHEYEKVDSHTIEFRVPVAPRSETVIQYMVRYTWPQ